MSLRNLDPCMDVPIYDFEWDFCTLLGDIKDYLYLSEANIDHLYQTELQSIQNRANSEEFLFGYREHLESNAEHRFKVSLPLRIRYSAILGLVTAVECTVKGVNIPNLPPKPSGKNLTVHKLDIMNQRVNLNRDEAIKDFESLVYVRNCIAHGAGLKEHDDYNDLPNKIQRLKGFSLENLHFLGTHIAIERGCIDACIGEVQNLVLDILKANVGSQRKPQS